MVKIELKYPLENLKEITVRRPKVKDLLEIEQLGDMPEPEKELILFEKLTGVSKELLKELDLYDYSQLQKAYQSFLS